MFYNAFLASAGHREISNQLLDTWNHLVALTYGSEYANTKPLTDRTMQEEYAKISKLRPKYKITKKGLEISGMNIEAEPKSKKK